jgi:hypothetical protein
MLDGTPVAATPVLGELLVSSLQPLRQGTCHIGCAASPVKGCSQRAERPTATPHAPPSFVRGTCGGIKDAVGRVSGAPLRLRSKATHPPPLP